MYAQLDGQLVRLSKAGDADAFARLYDRYADRVLGYMYFQMQEQQEAEDLAARVFARAWRSIGCCEDGEQPFCVWLYMIARQAVIDYRKSRAGQSAVTEIVSLADKGLDDYEPFRHCGSE